MKFKHFALAVVLIILFSLTAVAASEDITDEAVSHDDALVSLGYADNGHDNLSLADKVDLSVDMDVQPSYVDGDYNPVGSEVPWTVTVMAKGGAANNVQVREVLSPNLGYVSHNASVGEYDHASGIWNIGDLTRNSKASLTIITKLNRQGTYLNKVYATTDSNDDNLLNNFKFISIKTGSSKITSNITETTDDRFGARHDLHYQSIMGSRTEENSKPHEGGGGNSSSNSSGNFVNPSIKKSSYSLMSSVANTILAATGLDNKTSNSTDNPWINFFDSIKPYDYSMIPILIFSLFLIVFFVIVVYNKFKS